MNNGLASKPPENNLAAHEVIKYYPIMSAKDQIITMLISMIPPAKIISLWFFEKKIILANLPELRLTLFRLLLVLF